jgi:hypothetical protein
MTCVAQSHRSVHPGRLMFTVYLVNATLVICHEIDSAYWHEWDLFHLPGGAAGFVALHLILIPLVLVGLILIERGAASGRVLSLVIGLGGLAGSLTHIFFLWSGDDRFRTVFSTGLIAAFGLSSALLAASALAKGRARK